MVGVIARAVEIVLLVNTRIKMIRGETMLVKLAHRGKPARVVANYAREMLALRGNIKVVLTVILAK
jgi:hypothetical protein